MYVGGQFSSIQDIPASSLARLDTTTGQVDALWLPQLHSDEALYPEVIAVAAATDGSVYVGGDFSRVGPVRQKGIARFWPDAIFAEGFD